MARATYVTNSRQGQQAGLERADIRQKVLQAVSRLPGRQRRLLLLRELEGLSYAQVGETMGISPSRVAKMLHRARLKFKQAYSSQVAGRERKEKCRRLGHLLSAFCDGELLGLERRQVVEHLAECPDCRRIQDKLASISELLATLVPTPAPPGLADRILARTATSGISLAAGGGTIWKLPLMLLAGGGFIGAVVAVVLFLWQDSHSSSPLVLPLTVTPTATPTATAVATARATPSHPPVLTPAVTPLPRETRETIVPTPRPSATAVASSTPVVTATLTPTPTPIPSPSPTPSPIPSATPSSTPSPTPVPGPGDIQGSVTCQDQAVAGAQVTVSRTFPQAGQVWSGVTGGDGTFSTGLILDAGSYAVTIISPGTSYDSISVTVRADSYASVSAQCSLVYGPGH
jgi:hypothetical protein